MANGRTNLIGSRSGAAGGAPWRDRRFPVLIVHARPEPVEAIPISRERETICFGWTALGDGAGRARFVHELRVRWLSQRKLLRCVPRRERGDAANLLGWLCRVARHLCGRKVAARAGHDNEYSIYTRQ